MGLHIIWNWVCVYRRGTEEEGICIDSRYIYYLFVDKNRLDIFTEPGFNFRHFGRIR